MLAKLEHIASVRVHARAGVAVCARASHASVFVHVDGQVHAPRHFLHASTLARTHARTHARTRRKTRARTHNHTHKPIITRAQVDSQTLLEFRRRKEEQAAEMEMARQLSALMHAQVCVKTAQKRTHKQKRVKTAQKRLSP